MLFRMKILVVSDGALKCDLGNNDIALKSDIELQQC